MSRSTRRLRFGRLGPSQLIALFFAVTIALGTALLALPGTHAAGQTVTGLQALFTATSAASLTGLSLTDPATGFNLAGQLIILLLTQLGGLGLLAFGALYALYGRTSSAALSRATLSFGPSRPAVLESAPVARALRGVLAFTLISEALGAAALYVRLAPQEGPLRGAYSAVFHAVSAFNNAGFSLYEDGPRRSLHDPLVLLTTSALFLLGGLGYPVLVALVLRYRDPRCHPLDLNSRVALMVSAALILLGSVTITALEWRNPATLGSLSTPDKLLGGFFQGVTPRTAGFSALDERHMVPASLFLTLLLMLIGGNPGSTAGGIKTTTLFVLLSGLWSTLRGATDNTVFRRRIEPGDMARAGVIAGLSLVVLTLGLFALLVTNPRLSALNLLFEACSAFGSVGLSLGATPELNAAGQVVIIALMYLGRVGPLTLALALARRRRQEAVRFPADRSMIIG